MISDRSIDVSQGLQIVIHGLDDTQPPEVVTLPGSAPQIEKPSVEVPALPPPKDADPTLN